MAEFIFYWLPQILPLFLMAAFTGLLWYFLRKGTPHQNTMDTHAKSKSLAQADIARHLDRIASALEARAK